MDFAPRIDDPRERERWEFPADDGKPMEDLKHELNKTVLMQSLNRHASEAGLSVFTGGNAFVYFDPSNGKRNVGPDFFAVLDAKEDPDRDCWRVWNEGGKTPDVVVEFLSHSTEKKDRGKNFVIYRDVLKVGNYFLCDNRKLRLEGFRLTGRAYVAIEPDASGRLYCDKLGLYLGFCKGWLRWFRADGRAVETPDERAEQEAQRAEQEARGRREAEVRAAQLEVELERLRRKLEEPP